MSEEQLRAPETEATAEEKGEREEILEDDLEGVLGGAGIHPDNIENIALVK